MIIEHPGVNIVLCASCAFQGGQTSLPTKLANFFILMGMEMIDGVESGSECEGAGHSGLGLACMIPQTQGA